MALQVNILSPSKVVAKTAASQLQVPGILGYLGILPGHAPLVSELGVGELIVKGAEGGDQSFFVSGGYIDVANDQVTVLVDIVETLAGIDAQRAEQAKQRAEQRLKEQANIDFERANSALRRAEQRLALARRGS